MRDFVAKSPKVIDALVDNLPSDNGRNMRERSRQASPPQEVFKRLREELDPEAKCQTGNDVVAGESGSPSILLLIDLTAKLLLVAIRKHVNKFVIAVPTRAVVGR